MPVVAQPDADVLDPAHARITEQAADLEAVPLPGAGVARPCTEGEMGGAETADLDPRVVEDDHPLQPNAARFIDRDREAEVAQAPLTLGDTRKFEKRMVVVR